MGYLIAALVVLALFLFSLYVGLLFDAVHDNQHRKPRLSPSREDAPPNGERGA